MANDHRFYFFGQLSLIGTFFVEKFFSIRFSSQDNSKPEEDAIFNFFGIFLSFG
jgi:hypothetical protein